jgi:hypothetical protein
MSSLQDWMFCKGGHGYNGVVDDPILDLVHGESVKVA